MPAISIDLGQSSPAEAAALWLAATKTEKVQLRVPASGAPMPDNFDNPFAVFAAALIGQIIAALVGDFLRKRVQSFKQGERHDFNTVQAATLTLMALIIGFSFSMAVTRYDQRKTLEEAEANAIGTEYLRADLLPEESASRTRELLRKYLDLRIAFYEEARSRPATDIAQQTANVQGEMWNVVRSAATSQPTPTIALVALSCNLLVGYGERRKGELFLFVLPVVISLAFFLIADLDSPRGGAIRVHPQNLLAAAQSMKPP